MKTVSQLDARGYFVSTVEADESPLELGVYLIPGGAVDAPAPTIPEGQRALWRGAWVLEAIPLPTFPTVTEDTFTPIPVSAGDPAPVTGPRQITSLEFLDLFSEDEQLTIVTATMASPQVKLWYDKMLAASFITLADPRTSGGLQALVAAGLLTAERKDTIEASVS